MASFCPEVQDCPRESSRERDGVTEVGLGLARVISRLSRDEVGVGGIFARALLDRLMLGGILDLTLLKLKLTARNWIYIRWGFFWRSIPSLGAKD